MDQLNPDAILDRVLSFARARALFQPGVVVVAVSGGQDSVAMLDILNRLRFELQIEPRVAHLNHMFRGAQSEADSDFVRDLAARWGLPVQLGAVNVPTYRARHHFAKQVAARYARYQFLARTAAAWGSQQLAVGHTADDSVETLLLNLLRGSGLAGLGGILPSREMTEGQLGPDLRAGDWRTPEPGPAFGHLPTVVRPILELSRAETEAYCLARSLPFRSDPSNLDTSYRRNWIRARLMPLLERNAPGVRERLASTAALLADDNVVVSRAVEQLWLELATVAEGRVEFGLAAWQAVDGPLQRHLLRRAVLYVAGSLEGLGRVHVDLAQEAIRHGEAGSRIDLPVGVYVEKGYNSFRIGGRATPEPPADLPDRSYSLPVPGAAILPVGTIEATLIQAPRGGMAGTYDSSSVNEAYLDADRVSASLEVRRRRPGDRFYPLGMSEPKKLHDFLVDEKVPRGERNRVPIVATTDAIVWVAGHRIDERFKVTSATKRILVLKYRGIGDGG